MGSEMCIRDRIITDAQGTIIGLPTQPSDFDFDQLGPGTSFISSVNFNAVIGLELNENVDD